MLRTDFKNLSWFVSYLGSKKSCSIFTPTGIRELDYFIDGLYPQTVVIIGARPAEGKTTTILNIINNLYRTNKCAFFSTEISREKVVERLVSMNTKITHRNIRVDPNKYYNDIIAALPHMESPNLTIIDSPSPDIKDIEAISNLGYRFIFFDYFQNINLGVQDSSRFSNAYAYSKIVERMAVLSRNHNITFVVASQLKRFEDSPNREPYMSDLKETGKLEEAAHTVILLHKKDNELGFNVAKCKDGNIGKFFVKGLWDCGLII